uniref:Photosystem I assembly protein Ycf4 n=1 Tax=Tadehagi triquetrum TaxID=714511 RepID=A0A8A0WR42_9FABA|nr:photosystem I assembly protein ycf4 [Tadehagi triquetrum]QSQ71348.1 photosystem I assembly protein ycf4 [Tadehagi triquetrum]
MCRSENRLIYPITGSRKRSNLFWAFIILLGSLGLLSVAVLSYLGMDFFFLSKEISDLPFIPDYIDFPFIPQGATMGFYGLGGLLISFYLWWIILWNVGSGYDMFDKKETKVRFFRRGFPGKNRHIILEIPMEEVLSIRLKIIKEESFLNGILLNAIVYMETIEDGFIPLTRIEDDLLPIQIAEKAAEVSKFLDVPILYL